MNSSEVNNPASYHDDLEQALSTLRRGGIILYPTDTVWGIGCDATNAEAVSKIYALKRREDSKSMLSLVDGEGMLQRYVADIPEVAWQLIDAACSPLTIVYSHPIGLAPNLLAADGSAGVRITSERFSRDLCRRLGRPIVSTSANFSGEKNATDFYSINPEIVAAVDYAVGYGRDLGLNAAPSAIISLGDGGVVKVIR